MGQRFLGILFGGAEQASRFSRPATLCAELASEREWEVEVLSSERHTATHSELARELGRGTGRRGTGRAGLSESDGSSLAIPTRHTYGMERASMEVTLRSAVLLLAEAEASDDLVDDGVDCVGTEICVAHEGEYAG